MRLAVAKGGGGDCIATQSLRSPGSAVIGPGRRIGDDDNAQRPGGRPSIARLNTSPRLLCVCVRVHRTDGAAAWADYMSTTYALCVMRSWCLCGSRKPHAVCIYQIDRILPSLQWVWVWVCVGPKPTNAYAPTAI